MNIEQLLDRAVGFVQQCGSSLVLNARDGWESFMDGCSRVQHTEPQVQTIQACAFLLLIFAFFISNRNNRGGF